VYFRFLQFPLFGYVFTGAIFVYELIQVLLNQLKNCSFVVSEFDVISW
jgi:hypothetical protein